MGRVRQETEAPQISGPAAHGEASYSSAALAVQGHHSSRVLFICSCDETFPGLLTFHVFFKLRMDGLNGNLLKITNMQISLVENYL